MNAHVNDNTASIAGLLRLGDLAFLRSGYSFRSAVPESVDGNALAVQLKDIQRDGTVDWSRVIRTMLIRPPLDEEWLRQGDILFAFRGARFFALVLEDVPGPSIAATQFMLLRVHNRSAVLPAFLAWQLNQPPAQAYFDQSAEGTTLRSLRRSVVEALTVAVPSIEFQHSVVELISLARRERRALEELVKIREQQLNHIAYSLITAGQSGIGR